MAKAKLTITDFTKLANSDLLAILEMRNHPSIRCWMSNSNIIEVKEHLAFCHKLHLDPFSKYFFITFDDKPYGVVSVKALNENWQNAVTGYYKLTSSTYPLWKARRIILHFMQKNFGLKRSYLFINSQNTRSLTPFLDKKIPGVRLIRQDDTYHYLECTLPQEKIFEHEIAKYLQEVDVNFVVPNVLPYTSALRQKALFIKAGVNIDGNDTEDHQTCTNKRDCSYA